MRATGSGNFWRTLFRIGLVTVLLCFLAFPILSIKVNSIQKTLVFLPEKTLYLGLAVFGALFLRYLFWQNKRTQNFLRSLWGARKVLSRIIIFLALPLPGTLKEGLFRVTLILASSSKKWAKYALGGLTAALIISTPFVFSIYQTGIMMTAMIYMILGLGLNIVVGLGGMLFLGSAAFYAIGAYTYGMLHQYLGWGFWLSLPVAALISALCGIIIGIPVLRLRGDYLAIVTLAFGEIVRILINNLSEITGGAQGIKNIPKPSLPFIELSRQQGNMFLYFIILLFVGLMIAIVRRLEDSKVGRNWEAMREDEIACQAMGVNLVTTKLTALAMGAACAGVAGVFFGSMTSYINPGSFTINESIMVLCVAVLGGLGSVSGVIVGSLLMILLPEYLRFISGFRYMVFGLALVLVMVFRPGGLIPQKRRHHFFTNQDKSEQGE